MFLNASSAQISLSANASASVTSTFQWLLILGFPVEVAAAKAMPQLFSDSAPTSFITDGVRVFAAQAA